jgi:hypothetical protein
VAEHGEDAGRQTVTSEDPVPSAEVAGCLPGLPSSRSSGMGASRHRLHDPPAQGDFIRPIVTGIGRRRSEGRVIHLGSRLATAEPRLTGGAGKLHAHAVGTCLVVVAR